MIVEQINRLSERIAANRRRHKPVRDLQYMRYQLRLAQIRSENRADWLEEARRQFNRRYYEETKPDTRGHGSQCGTELGQDVRSQRADS